MSKYGFNLLWSEEDQGFIVTCPDFPGLSAFGETPEEALCEAKIALELFIASLQATGDSLPKATECFDYSGQTRLRMPKTLHSSLAHQADKEGVSLNTWLITLLSERNATSKLVDKVCSRIDTVEKAIHVHRTETKQIRIQQEISYTPELIRGGEYEKLHLTLIKGPRLVSCNFSLNEVKQQPKKKPPIKCQYAIEVNIDEEKNEVSAFLSAKSDSVGLPFSFDLKSEARFKCEVSCPSEQHIIIEAIPYIYPFVKELIADLTRKSYYPPFYLPPIELKPESFEKVDE